jgi:hypothetical protein
MKSIVCLKKSMTRLVSVRLISPFWIIINGLALPNPQPRGSKYVQYQYMYTIYIYVWPAQKPNMGSGQNVQRQNGWLNDL